MMQVGKHLSLTLLLIQAFVVHICLAQVSPGVFQFKEAEINVNEGLGGVNVVVENIGNTSATVTLRVTTSDMSATSGVDYIATTENILFSPGDTEKEVYIVIIDDDDIEGEEAFEVKLSLIGPARPSVTLGAQTSTTVVIQDNDAPTAAPTDAPIDSSTASTSADGGNITLDEEAKIEVVCEADYIEVTLLKTDFPGLIVNDSVLHLKDANCGAGYKDDDQVKFMFGLEDCGTTQDDDGDRINYSNEIHLTADVAAADAAITRKHSEVIPFQCGYDKKTTISKVSYSPRSTQVITNAEGYGNFTYEMYMYEDANMDTMVVDFPKAVGLGQKMYFGFKVTSDDGELNVFPDACKATASSEYDSTPDHLIIDNACSSDNTLEYDYKAAAVQQFNVSAFRFKENYDTVYFHCKLTVCRSSDTGSRCDRGCDASRRRRRSLEDDMSANLHIGPVYLNKNKNREADAKQNNVAAESSNNSMVVMVAVLVGILGTVAVGLVAAVIIIGRRRRYAAINKGASLIVAEEM